MPWRPFSTSIYTASRVIAAMGAPWLISALMIPMARWKLQRVEVDPFLPVTNGRLDEGRMQNLSRWLVGRQPIDQFDSPVPSACLID
jgi:hypothetical protein